MIGAQMLSLLASADAASESSNLLLWVIGGGALALTAGFAYIGKLAMSESGGRDDRETGAGLGTILGELELKPVAQESEDPADARAFATIAKKLKLKRSQKLVLRKIAQASEMPAPAVLLSEHAFDRAIEAVMNGEPLSPTSEAGRDLIRLRARIFADK